VRPPAFLPDTEGLAAITTLLHQGLGTRPIQKYVERLLQAGSKAGIIVYRNNVTAIARKLLVPGAIPNVRVEVFKEAELLVDITEHQLVPEHVVLTAEQKQEVLTRYKLKDTQLPKIQSSDPVARYFGLVRGQVVKIIRLSETAGRYITYRVCV
jgi:DNA-directed RNA polymerases I, II, and III subunit RPABC1